MFPRARRPKSSPTIRDIARLAQVSTATVSRVLNDDARVTEANRQAVRAAMLEVRYRPSAAAQDLARGRSPAFGVITEDVTSEFYGQILKGIVLGLRGTGYFPVFTSGWTSDEAGEALELLLRNRVDALISVGRFDEDRLRQVAAEIPILNIGPTIPGLEDRCVIVDNTSGAVAATSHLLGLGHRRIAHIAGPAYHRHSADRLVGYRSAMEAARCPADPRLIVEGDFGSDSGAAAAEQLLATRLRFTAIFVANDLMAYGAMHTLSRRGLRVPRDVSVIGFDDRPYSSHFVPALTTMRQPSTDLGRAAAEALLREIGGGQLSPPTFATPLVVRESTAPPPARSRQARRGKR